jgi:non-lysosomal glucosylceramidase
MMENHDAWPVLRTYTGESLARIALPLGGIGTGTVSLGGRGDLRDWEIMQRPSKGFAPENTFFCVYAGPPAGDGTRTGGVGSGRSKLLEGPMDGPLDSMNGFRNRVNGLPRFREAVFRAAYPLASVDFLDDEFPLDVRLEAFNPLIPCDPDSSGIPAAVLRYVLRNPTGSTVRAAVCGSVNNYIGYDGVEGAFHGNENEFRDTGIFMCGGGDPTAPQTGTMALALLGDGFEITHRTNWAERAHYFASRMDFWRDFSEDGRLDERPAGGSLNPTGSVCGTCELAPGEEKAWIFLLTWHFPNRYTWTPRVDASVSEYNSVDTEADTEGGCCDADKPDGGEGCCCEKGADEDLVGNYYTTRYADAWAVAEELTVRLPELERETCLFVRGVVDSDLPDVVKEAALFNLPALRSQTAFRTADGNFYGWEGCNDTAGCCYGMNPHVWNYEHATAFLFGAISRGMRRVEFLHATDQDGSMSFRVNLPLSRATEMGKNAADGQMGCIIKLYRDWQLSGDDGFLRELWPAARRALEFAWVPGGWDADKDGVMEGIQHNTTDLNFYGPNPMMTGWYLAALDAASRMAEYLGENEFADDCRELHRRGRNWMAEHLFDGEYFRQEIRIPPEDSPIAGGILTEGFMKRQFQGEVPSDQPGDGCMTDQTIGQYMADVCGLDPVFDSGQLDSALDSIYRYNFIRDLWNHPNPIRAFAVNGESMVVCGTYPHGLPDEPCFRFPENWTGVEYAFGALLMYHGQIERGLEVFRAVRERFDGKKRSPFDEPECGHHYSRAMAAWSALPILTGFRYTGVTGTMRFTRPPGKVCWFWSTGGAWGTVQIGRVVQVSVLGGEVRIERVYLDSITGGSVELSRSIHPHKDGTKVFAKGDTLRFEEW